MVPHNSRQAAIIKSSTPRNALLRAIKEDLKSSLRYDDMLNGTRLKKPTYDLRGKDVSIDVEARIFLAEQLARRRDAYKLAYQIVEEQTYDEAASIISERNFSELDFNPHSYRHILLSETHDLKKLMRNDELYEMDKINEPFRSSISQEERRAKVIEWLGGTDSGTLPYINSKIENAYLKGKLQPILSHDNVEARFFEESFNPLVLNQRNDYLSKRFAINDFPPGKFDSPMLSQTSEAHDSGFEALNLSTSKNRDRIVSLLEQHASIDHKIYELVSPEIQNYLEKRISSKSSEQWIDKAQPLLKQFLNNKNSLKKTMDLLNDHIQDFGPEINPHRFLGFLKSNENKYSAHSVDLNTKILKYEDSQKKLNEYLKKPEVFKKFIELYKWDRGLTYGTDNSTSTLDALAYIHNMNVKVLRQTVNGGYSIVHSTAYQTGRADIYLLHEHTNKDGNYYFSKLEMQ